MYILNVNNIADNLYAVSSDKGDMIVEVNDDGFVTIIKNDTKCRLYHRHYSIINKLIKEND